MTASANDRERDPPGIVSAEQWEELLPERLRELAYREPNGELAWNRDAALEVIGCATRAGYLISRVEVWLPTTPGPTIPTPFIYTWRLHRQKQLPGHGSTAEDFIRNFRWDPADTAHHRMAPYFNLLATLAESPK